jgi:hypothetical protein
VRQTTLAQGRRRCVVAARRQFIVTDPSSPEGGQAHTTYVCRHVKGEV